MKASVIKSFSIYGLFGTNDVHIPFEEDVKILIGENGLGKTQVLNIFYYTLTRNFFKLREFSFNRLRLDFVNDSYIEINKAEVEDFFDSSYKNPIIKEVIDNIGYSQFERLRNEFVHGRVTRSRFNEHPLYRALSRIGPIDLIYRSIEETVYENRLFSKDQKPALPENLEFCKNSISKNISGKLILYFPTFRRVEEDLHNLGYDEDKFKLNREDTRLIHFGMEDVKRRFNNIEDKIDTLLKEGFSKISSEILSQLVKGFSGTDINILSRINQNDIEIILARVGNQIPQSDKDKIRDIVLKGEIREDDKNLSLLYFLQKLIDIYEKQRELDNSIKIFRDLCNKYLINKKVFYDESAIKIYIRSDITHDELLLSKLSSGEKQIISIFSKIYLSGTDHRFIMLVDEPELSLSMTWQKQLLPDILQSKKCDFMLAVTHSPFIFDNDLDQYAIGLNEYVTPLEHPYFNFI
jgi:predicted ATP-dependent endonuclease of OLD family